MYNVVPALDALKAFGFNAKDWLVKAAKSKTMWFATALTVFGAIEGFLPQIQSLLGSHYGAILSVVGVITGLLRFATTDAISNK
jgi:hypothetical protein